MYPFCYLTRPILWIFPDCTAPFAVQFVSNSIAIADTPGAQAQRGFCLEFKQVACWFNYVNYSYQYHQCQDMLGSWNWYSDVDVLIIIHWHKYIWPIFLISTIITFIRAQQLSRDSS